MIFDGKELYKDCKAGLHRPAGQDHQAREHIFGILVKVQVLWEGQYCRRALQQPRLQQPRLQFDRRTVAHCFTRLYRLLQELSEAWKIATKKW